MDLKVKTDPVSEQLTWFVERLLTMLSGMAVAGNAEKASRFRADLSIYKNQLLHPKAGESLDATSRKCLALCQDYFDEADSYRLNHDSEYAAIIDLLREAITSLVEGSHCDGMVISSARRFRELVAVEDIHDLRLRIEAEVQTLDETIRQREALQGETIRSLTKKVQGLEQKLSRTKKRLNETQVENAVDPLTMVSNRRHFDQQLERWLHSAKDSGQFVLAMIDIDNFKRVNDDFGHQAGDRVLKDVARCIRSMIRNEDVLARYGGEEFALLLHNIDAAKADQRCRRILEAIRLHNFQCNHDANLIVSVSCGLSEFISGDSPNEILQRADLALYQAKKNGKDRVEIRHRSRGPSWLSSMRRHV